MNPKPLQIAIVYPGDAEARRLATPKNNRFAALFDAFAAQGVLAHPVVFAGGRCIARAGLARALGPT